MEVPIIAVRITIARVGHRPITPPTCINRPISIIGININRISSGIAFLSCISHIVSGLDGTKTINMSMIKDLYWSTRNFERVLT